MPVGNGFHFYWFSRFIFSGAQQAKPMAFCWRCAAHWVLLGAMLVAVVSSEPTKLSEWTELIEFSSFRRGNLEQPKTMQRSEKPAENLFRRFYSKTYRRSTFYNKNSEKTKCLHFSSHKTIESFSSLEIKHTAALFFLKLYNSCGECAIPAVRARPIRIVAKKVWIRTFSFRKVFLVRSCSFWGLPRQHGGRNFGVNLTKKLIGNVCVPFIWQS